MEDILKDALYLTTADIALKFKSTSSLSVPNLNLILDNVIGASLYNLAISKIVSRMNLDLYYQGVASSVLYKTAELSLACFITNMLMKRNQTPTMVLLKVLIAVGSEKAIEMI